MYMYVSFYAMKSVKNEQNSCIMYYDELRQGAKQLSRGVEQYYLSTEVSLLVSVWFGWRARGCDELGMQWIENMAESSVAIFSYDVCVWNKPVSSRLAVAPITILPL